MKGKFITIEGIEGVGKTTLLNWIEHFFLQAKKEFVLTREPGGTPLAEEIRKILLMPTSEPMQPDTELLLMFAARKEHIVNVILPALSLGKYVVSDRFIDATFAYQGGGRRMDKEVIRFLDAWIVNTLKPDITILLDAPVAVGLQRAKYRGPKDRIEQEKIDFFERVRHAYLLRAKEEAARFRIIDAAQSLETVQKELTSILETL